MGQPLSMDLRSRLLGAVDAGMSCRSAADRFGVAPSTAIRWQAQRRAWFEGQLDLDPERLVFIDETWTATNMTRSHGRCARGERLRMGFPHGHRKTTTLVAGLRMSGMIAPMVLDGPINGDWFEAYVVQVLVVFHHVVHDVPDLLLESRFTLLLFIR